MKRAHPRVAFLTALFFGASARAATLLVTNTNDSGPGSLRQAILDSNASVGVLDTIQFNIPGSGVHVISPPTIFNAISDPVVIDGYTQPGASPNTLAVGDNAVILIQLNGPGNNIALSVSGGNSTIRGIAITNFGTALSLSGAGSNIVEGCFLGINPTGATAAPNNVGIIISNTAPNDRIGGSLPAQRNLISGQTGVAISAGAPNTSILGNYIGTDRTGTVGIGNVTAITGTGTNNKVGGTAAGEGNLISGNSAAVVVQGSGGWTIEGNLIGTDVTGTLALGNSGVGVNLGGANNNVIGGTTAASRNIISANDRAISINGGDGNVIQGNYIGTDVTGTVPLGNIRYGISTGNSAMNTIIGGLATVAGQPPGNVIAATQGTASPGGDLGAGITTNAGNGSPANSAAGTLIEGNLIGTDKTGFRVLGNRIGVFLGEPGATLGGTDPKASNVISGSFSAVDGGVVVANNNDVIGNLIGTDISSLHPLGNASHGILIKGGTAGSIQQNVIAYNAGSGVRVTAGTGYRIIANSIYDNFLPGIDLGVAAGITLNDTGDADNGPNNLQNFPVITSAINNGTNTTIAGTLNSTPNTTFTVEFFASSVRDATGFGQAENSLDTAIVTTDASGNATFNLSFAQLNDGQWITATATDPNGNTSEFSAAVAVSGPSILNGTTVTARTGQPFRFRVFTAGGTPTQRLSATGLPPGLTANSITGVISGAPTAAGSFNSLLTVTDGAVSTTASLEIVCVSDPALPVIVSPNFVVVPKGQPFSYKIEASSNAPQGDVTTYSIFGPLPTGLSFNPSTGIISGTVATVQEERINPRLPTLSGGTLLSVIQLFATNSAGRTTLPLLFLQLPPMPVNISTRLAVGTNQNVLIGGFIVTGNAPKIVIVRGIGPSLTASGVPGALQDPVLELHDAGGALLAMNDNWRTDQEAEIRETTIPPLDERESAIVALLDPANYTAVFRGANNTTGVGLVEAYDLGTASMDVAAAAQLANLSTRGLVGTDNNVMIGGVIAANGTARFLLRAIGPSLGGAGVQGALQDPALELHGANGDTLASNDNWKLRPDGSSQQAEIEATTIPPSNNLESALIQMVVPGNYTAIVRGKNNTGGVALVELYNLP